MLARTHNRQHFNHHRVEIKIIVLYHKFSFTRILAWVQQQKILEHRWPIVCKSGKSFETNFHFEGNN